MTRAFKPPVFIIGSPRSGTTLLYHILLSSGDFAVYRSETNAFNLIGRKYGDLRTERAKRSFMKMWFDSYQFKRTGLDRDFVANRLLNECDDTGNFLRMMMESIASAQGMGRWAECTPDHALYIEQIKAEFPDALVIHMIRDGRDAALSLSKLGWIRPFPWDNGRELIVAALFWKWIVKAGRTNGMRSGLRYLEVRFEDLVTDPVSATERIGQFIDHDIDYDRVQAAGIGSVSKPNTSFDGEKAAVFHPVGRWRESLDPAALVLLEATIGDELLELGYELEAMSGPHALSLAVKAMHMTYPSYFAMKQWVRANTPLSRYLISTAIMEAPLAPSV